MGYTRGLDLAQNEDTATDTITEFPISSMARPWTSSAYKYNYGKFIDGLMGSDRLHELLAFFKEVPRLVSQRFNDPDI